MTKAKLAVAGSCRISFNQPPATSSTTEAAGEVTLQRDGRHIEIESEYYEHIELPLYVREVRFNPHAEGIF